MSGYSCTSGNWVFHGIALYFGGNFNFHHSLESMHIMCARVFGYRTVGSRRKRQDGEEMPSCVIFFLVDAGQRHFNIVVPHSIGDKGSMYAAAISNIIF